MIKLFVDKEKHLALDAIFLDEAQDLNPSQWRMVFHIEAQCKRSYIAGDDDQTIFNFQGADSNIFIDLPGERDDQEKSYRVPKVVHREALKILPHITKRVEKNWYPKDEEGEFIENCFLEEMDFSKGEWMVLATTNKLLKDFAEYFYRKGLRIFGKNNSILPNSVLEAYRFWIKLNNGELLPIALN
jgi:superfamily I DNA/RNA helicase